jgi:hypothetical protein
MNEDEIIRKVLRICKSLTRDGGENKLEIYNLENPKIVKVIEIPNKIKSHFIESSDEEWVKNFDKIMPY